MERPIVLTTLTSQRIRLWPATGRVHNFSKLPQAKSPIPRAMELLPSQLVLTKKQFAPTFKTRNPRTESWTTWTKENCSNQCRLGGGQPLAL